MSLRRDAHAAARVRSTERKGTLLRHIWSMLLASVFIAGTAHADEDARFMVKMTVIGQETVSFEDRQYNHDFPYFEIRGRSYTRTETVPMCVPADLKLTCTLDKSRTHSTTTNLGAQYGLGGPGYGIFVNTINSPGGPQSATYILNEANLCLTSTVTVQAQHRQRGWYQATDVIYLKCPNKQKWTRTQTQGPFTLSAAADYPLVASYTGGLGSTSGIPGTAVVDPGGYSAEIIDLSPSGASLTSGMFKVNPTDGENGPLFYADYTAANDLRAHSLEITQGIQNLANRMPLVANRRTYARLHVQSDLPLNGVATRVRAFVNGHELAGSPLLPEHDITIRATGLNRTKLNHAYLFKFPSIWTAAARLDYRAEVDFDGRILEPNESNNILVGAVDFQVPAHAIDMIVPVPLHLHEGGDHDEPLRIYDHTRDSYHPIKNNLLRFHPIAATATLDCGFPPMKPRFHTATNEWHITRKKDWEHMVSHLRNKRFWSGCGLDPSYWLGPVSPDLPEFGQRPLNGIASGSKAAIVAMQEHSDCWGLPGECWNMPGGNTLAHEVGHNKDLDHVKCNGNEDDPNGGYPYPHPACRLADGATSFFAQDKGNDGFFGLDVYHDLFGIADPMVISNDPDAFAPHLAFPVMGYKWPRWMSPFDYCLLLDDQDIPCDASTIAANSTSSDNAVASAGERRSRAARARLDADYPEGAVVPPPPNIPPVHPVLPPGYVVPTVSAGAGNYLALNGVFDPVQGTVEDYALMKVPAIPSTTALQDSQALRSSLVALTPAELAALTGVLVLDQYSESPRTLVRSDIVVPDEGFVGGGWPFLDFVEMEPGAASFELHYGSLLVQSTTPSAHPPTINLLPYAFSTLTPNTSIEWAASDADDDELTFDVFYSADGGTSWNLIDTVESDTTSYDIPGDLRNFKGTNTGLFKVTAYDGFHTASAQLASVLSVPGSPPRAHISQPDGLQAKVGTTVFLNAEATDIEDGPMGNGFTADTDLVWSSSLEGVLGNGNAISTRTLSEGLHTITFAAEDSDGEIGSDTIRVCVGRNNGDLCEDRVNTSVLVGTRDGFTDPTELLSPSAYALAGIGTFAHVDLDDSAVDAARLHTFTGLAHADGITLRFKAKPLGSGAVVNNDSISLQFFGQSGLDAHRWNRRFGSDGQTVGLRPNAWDISNYPDGFDFEVDLAALPLADGGQTNLLPTIREKGFLDFYVQDDTAIDYIELIVIDYRSHGVFRRVLDGSILAGGSATTRRPDFDAAVVFETLNQTHHGGVPRDLGVVYPTSAGRHTFGHSFENLPQIESNAVVELEIGLIADQETSGDDIVRLQYTGTAPSSPTPLTASNFLWSAPLSKLKTLPKPWANGAIGAVRLNLASLPNGGDNLVTSINELGYLDVFVADDTGVSYIKLTASPDSDADGLLDVDELLQRLDPYSPDSDGDGVPDGSDPHPDVPGDGNPPVRAVPLLPGNALTMLAAAWMAVGASFLWRRRGRRQPPVE